MRSKKVLIAVLASVLLGAGCSQFQNNKEQAKDSFADHIFYRVKQAVIYGIQKGSRIIKQSGEGYIRNLTDQQKNIIADWLAKNRLNEFGDPIGTIYAGGTPLFDERTGESKDRFEFLFKKFPELKDIVQDKIKLQEVEILE